MLKSSTASRVISFILTAMMVISCIPFSMWQASEVYGAESWDGSSVSESLEQADDGYYLISSGADLAKFAQMALEGKVNGRLAADVDLGGHEWTPIGKDSGFSGSFDGAGFTVSGLSITNADGCSSLGLFGILESSDGVIRDLKVKGKIADNSGSALCIGGLAGMVYSFNGRIVNCSSEVNVPAAGDETYSGKLVGAVMSSGSVFENCGGDVSQLVASGLAGYSDAVKTEEAEDDEAAADAADENQDASQESEASDEENTTDVSEDSESEEAAAQQARVAVRAMVRGTASLSSSAAAAEEWDGETLSEELQVDDEGYYLIANGADLAKFASLINDEGQADICGRLTACINLGDKAWTPIGYEYYEGSFDGAGHTVTGLNVDGYDFAGLFGYAAYSSIKSLTVEGSVSGVYAGGIAGYGVETVFSKCSNKVAVTGSEYAGGLLGFDESYFEAEQCSNHGTVHGVSYSGGITGHVLGSSLNRCYNAGKLSSDYCAAGLVGLDEDDWTILDFCYNSADFKGYAFVGEGEAFISDTCNTGSCTKGLDGYGVIDESQLIDLNQLISKSKGAFAADGKLAWEAAAHKDEAAATDEEKAAALEKLTYNEEKYYDEQLAEIEAIIAEAEEELDSMSIFPSALDGYIEGVQLKIDAVRTKEHVDAVKNGKKTIDDAFAKLNEEDYDAAEWETIEKTVSDAKSDIDTAKMSEIQTIADNAVKAINNVMTKADKAALSELRDNAKKEVADYIDAVKKDYSKELELIKDNETACNRLKAEQDAIVKTYFQTYIDGEKASEVDDMTAKEDLNQWVEEAKACVDKNKDKGLITKLSTQEDLMKFAEKVNSSKEYAGLYAMLATDIDVSGSEWIPIGETTSTPYSGMFFGNGKTVTINCSAGSYDIGGFFGATDGAYIENLTVAGSIAGKSTGSSYGTGGIIGRVYSNTSNSETMLINCHNKSTVAGANYTGGLVGNIYGNKSSTAAVVTIKNCSNSGSVSGRQYVGGIVGGAYNNVNAMSIINCSNSGEIKATSSYLAGIVGYANSAKDTITGCSNMAGINTTSQYAAGIIGYVYQKGYLISDCTNTGTITSSASSSEGVYAGGIIAASRKNSSISGNINNCANAGNIACGGRTGGIAGYLYGANVSRCYNEGNISSDNLNHSENGGIAGYFNGTMSYVYNMGSLNMKGYAHGGIVGTLAGGSAKLSNAYNAGNVAESRTWNNNGYGAVMGFKGGTLSEGAISNCYALEGTCKYLIYSQNGELGDTDSWLTDSILKSGDVLTTLNGEAAAENGFIIAPDGINGGYPTFDWVVAEVIKKLSAKKLQAIQEIKDTYDPEDYYEPQKGLVTDAVASAIAAIEAISGSLQLVDVVKAEWQKTIDTYETKEEISAKLEKAKKEACAKLNTYLEFSGYGEESQQKLEQIKGDITSAINGGKLDINAVTPQEYAANEKIVEEKLTACEDAINELFMKNGIWSGNNVSDDYAPQAVNGTYQISNAVELAWFAQQVNNKKNTGINAVLTSDIDLGNLEWTPIGRSGAVYYGTFNGQGHTVYGMNIKVESSADKEDKGLFGYGENTAEISNLTVKGSITGKGNKVYNSGTGYGGIAGQFGGRITGCTSYVDINLDAYNVGGICGYGVYVSNCVNNGNVKGGNSVGGIVGRTYQDGIITYSHNTGTIKGGGAVGGILGSMEGGIIRNCYNIADVDGNLGSAGGIAGSVSGTDETITNVYNTGDIFNDTGVSTGNAAGGLVGSMGYNTSSGTGSGGASYEGIISNGYSIGSITNGGALVGKLSGGKLYNCYAASSLEMCGRTMTSNTSLNRCVNLGADGMSELKSYAAKLGSAFCEDTSNVNGGFPILGTSTDSADLSSLKTDAITTLWKENKTVYKKSEYGKQYNALLKEVQNQQSIIEAAASAEEVSELLEAAKAAISAVPTELELQRTESVNALQKIIDENLYNEEKQAEITELFEKAKGKIAKAKTAADVSALEKEYAEKMANIATYPQGAITDLESHMTELAKDADTVQKLQLQALLNKASDKIKAAETKESIDDIVGEYRQLMAESMSEASLPGVAVTEDDALAAAKEIAYNEVLAAISAGLEDDYREGHWENIKNICGKAASDIAKAETAEAIENARDEAVKAIKDVPVDASLAAAEGKLQASKDAAYEKLAALEKDAEAFSEKDRAEAAELLGKARDNISAVTMDMTSAGKLEENLEKAIAEVGELLSAAEKSIADMTDKLEKTGWTEDTTEPELEDGWYLVGKPQELAWIAEYVNSADDSSIKNSVNIKLTSDIDLSGSMWIPIGIDAKPFSGTFDGQGHAVSGMNVSAKEYGNGLFGYTRSAEIKNVTVSGTIKAHSASASKVVKAGGIAGAAECSKITDCISNVRIASASKTSDSWSYLPYLGGIVGYAEGGYSGKTIISGCTNNGDITAGVYKNIGGIAGFAGRNTQIIKCSNAGNMTGDTCADVNPNTNSKRPNGIGGIIGYASGENVNVSHSYNSGNVSGMHYVGGLIGQVSSSGSSDKATCVNNSYNSGIVTGVSSDSTGAITGYASGGRYVESIFTLDSSNSKAMGYVPVSNMIETVAADILAAAETVTALNGTEDCFIASVAGLNGGNPLFKWQLTASGAKKQIVEYLKKYLNENDFTAEQWEKVQSDLADNLDSVNNAKSAEDVVDAYDKAVAELNGAADSIKKALADKLNAYDIEDYDKKVRKAIKNYIGGADEDTPGQEDSIISAVTAAAAQQIFDESMAGIVDILINAVPEVKDVNCGNKLADARNAYTGLTDAQKECVSGFIKLQRAEEEYSANSIAAKAVADKIDAIKKVSIADKAAIKDARNEYDKLTEAQKSFIPEGTYDKLVLAEDTLQALIDEALAKIEDSNNKQDGSDSGNNKFDNAVVSGNSNAGITSAGVAALQSAMTGGASPKAATAVQGQDAAEADEAMNLDEESVMITSNNGAFSDSTVGSLGWKLIPIGLAILAMLAVAYGLIRWIAAARNKKRV